MGIRTIIFRGKRKDNGEWIEGYYASRSNHACFANELKHQHFILKDVCFDFNLGGLQEFEVAPETVGQYTGFTDKNGKRIFEGDIIRKTNEGRHPKIFTANIHTDFRVNEEVHYGPCEHFKESCEYEIIGNIHDNPELLKGGDG